MAESKLDWSEETYRLDEIASKFSLPQLIQLTEGVHTDSEVDSFSAEDILTIDRCVTLQKVSAQFAEKVIKETSNDGEYAILKEEILIPLNYKGKLKVINEIKRHDSVRELAKDFPRFAKILEALSVVTEEGVVNIAANSIIELDRVFPAQKTGKKLPDRLVVSTAHGGRRQVALPFDKRCRFRSVQDQTEYTMKEMIDRYSLPQVICFLDKQIQEIYTQNLIEGVEQVANISTASALRINKLVLQKVLIGHYTNPEDPTRDSQKFCKRTLVVIPYDTPDIGEINVRIYKGEEDSPDYEEFLVENVSTEIAEGLYVEFLKKPRIILLKEDESNKAIDDVKGKEHDQPPPPVPPRPGQKGKDKPHVPQKPKKRIPAIDEVNKKEEVVRKLPPQPNEKHKNVKFNAQPGETKPPSKEEEEDYEQVDTLPALPKLKVSTPSPNPRKSEMTGALPKTQTTTPSPSPATSTWTGTTKSQTATSSPSSPKPTLPNALPTTLFPLAESTPSLADISFDQENVENKRTKGKTVLHKISGMLKGRKHCTETSSLNQEDTITPEDDIDQDLNVYDEPDDYEKPMSFTTPGKIAATSKDAFKLSKETKRPIAQIPPLANPSKSVAPVKEFRLLKKEELEQRLIQCGMAGFAKFCEREKLDGEFLFRMDEDTLKSLGLSGFNEQKLKRVIAGWIPSP